MKRRRGERLLFVSMHDYQSTRLSWDVATRNHNAHKGDQARYLREGGEVLFPEELELLGDVSGKRLVHLQCNSGQDSLCLARRGARVTGVDFSGEAITFARRLSEEAQIAASFVEAELVSWLESTEARFDVAFSSYGAVAWLPDLEPWARGIARILEPGGRFVYMEFHPLCWSIGADLTVTGDDYFEGAAFRSPVRDYVAASGSGLGAPEGASAGANEVTATAWQHGLAQIVQALLGAGLQLESLKEYPYANGCRIHDALQPAAGRRWVWPRHATRTPLMFGLTARRPLTP